MGLRGCRAAACTKDSRSFVKCHLSEQQNCGHTMIWWGMEFDLHFLKTSATLGRSTSGNGMLQHQKWSSGDTVLGNSLFTSNSYSTAIIPHTISTYLYICLYSGGDSPYCPISIYMTLYCHFAVVNCSWAIFTMVSAATILLKLFSHVLYAIIVFHHCPLAISNPVQKRA